MGFATSDLRLGHADQECELLSRTLPLRGNAVPWKSLSFWAMIAQESSWLER